MNIILILIVSTLNIVCFLCGAKVGQKVTKGEDIHLPTLNPAEAIREREAKREARREQDKIDTIMRNIDAYDGTGYHQEDVPR